MDISVQELKQKLDAQENFVLIDVREPWENAEFNLGGQLISIGDLGNHLEDLLPHRHDEIVVYCRSGARSGLAKSILTAQGFSNVRNTLGGVLAWQEAFGK